MTPTYTQESWNLNQVLAGQDDELLSLARRHAASTALHQGLLDLLANRAHADVASSNSYRGRHADVITVFGKHPNPTLRFWLFRPNRDQVPLMRTDSFDSVTVVVDGTIQFRSIEHDVHGKPFVASEWLAMPTGYTFAAAPNFVYETRVATGALALEICGPTIGPARQNDVDQRLPMSASDWRVRLELVTQLFRPEQLAPTLLRFELNGSSL